MSGAPEPVLCYVDGRRAWFTTCPLAKQWGDDWNDSPYEHNAGDPYDWQPYMKDVEPYEIVHVYFEGADLETPADGYGNSRWSVEAINAGGIAWLRTWGPGVPVVNIFAGTPLSEFKRLVRRAGGRVFVEEKEVER